MAFFTQRLVACYARIFCLLLTSCWSVQAQNWEAATSLPTAAGGTSSVNNILADGSGGYVISGSFTGTITLGSFILTSKGNQDLFVARLSSLGSYSQAVSFGGIGTEAGGSLVLDATGSVIIAGSFDSPTINFGTSTLTKISASGTNSDLFIARLNLAGQWTQAALAGGPGEMSVTGIALDPTGTTVVVGSFTGGNATFGSLTVQSDSYGGAFFVARLSSTGSWTQALTANGDVPNSASGVAVDANGSAWVYGTCLSGGTLTFGSFTLTTATGMAVFVARLNRTGTWVQLSKATSASSVIYSADIALDKSGNAVVIGNFRGADVNFGTTSLTYNGLRNSQSSDNLFVARLTGGGSWTQAVQATGSNYHSASSLALDANGNVLLTGTFRSPSITFGATTLTNSNSNPGATLTDDIFLARLTMAGTWASAIQAGGMGNDFPSSVLVDGSSAIIAGNFQQNAAFGALTISTPATSTGFIARTGNILSSSQPNAIPSICFLAPNPATAASMLTLSAMAAPCPIQLLDALGREVRSFVLPAHATTLLLDLAGLPAGIYVVRYGLTNTRLEIKQ
ncbi:hypothetical protein [Hymenobacter sp. BRD67]|uniref:hypothetical protein n=1 Tax=Hymenobacter sp. BRD67 TaxID=2675877 RepID=UPI001566BB5A|nr:hypothetical protein [Hymenobacter sp. BRD67]QKG51590.1 hypothetical protein GKZ67_02025 [Hymenobacter sp. BRD67]